VCELKPGSSEDRVKKNRQSEPGTWVTNRTGNMGDTFRGIGRNVGHAVKGDVTRERARNVHSPFLEREESLSELCEGFAINPSTQKWNASGPERPTREDAHPPDREPRPTTSLRRDDDALRRDRARTRRQHRARGAPRVYSPIRL